MKVGEALEGHWPLIIVWRTENTITHSGMKSVARFNAARHSIAKREPQQHNPA